MVGVENQFEMADDALRRHFEEFAAQGWTCVIMTRTSLVHYMKAVEHYEQYGF
jgi:hypothetical protein